MSIRTMPTDVMIQIFGYLAPKEVLLCENISTLCRDAANHYYSRNIHHVQITHDSVAVLSDKLRSCISSFAKLLIRLAGHHIVCLTIDYSVYQDTRDIRTHLPNKRHNIRPREIGKTISKHYYNIDPNNRQFRFAGKNVTAKIAIVNLRRSSTY